MRTRRRDRDEASASATWRTPLAVAVGAGSGEDEDSSSSSSEEHEKVFVPQPASPPPAPKRRPPPPPAPQPQIAAAPPAPAQEPPILLPSGAELAGVNPASVPFAAGILPGRRALFRAANADALQRRYVPPGTALATPAAARQALTWQRSEIRNMLLLEKQPWYKLAMLMAGIAGLPLSQMLVIETAQGRDPFRADPELSQRQRRQPQQPTPQKEGVLPAESDPLDEFFAQEENDAAPGPRRALTDAERADAARVGRWLSRPQASGVVFFSPLFVSARESALVRVQMDVPGMVGVTLEAIMAHPQASVLFATVAASLANTALFASGRAGERGSDYGRYLGRIDEAMAAFWRWRYDAQGKRLVNRPGFRV